MPDPASTGGTVATVDAGAARDAGLLPRDRVLAVDGAPLADVIDWWWLTDEPSFSLTIERDGAQREVEIIRRPGEALGVTFTETLFTPIRECDNACAFCFVSQLPGGLRPSLYVRDDDFRLSFLSGNFVTLTNATAKDVARIITQHLSPLHVSVHAVDPEVRARLICPTVEDHALEVLDTVLDAGIKAHVQVVLVPGVNDGAVLEQTLGYLAARSGVLSVGTVPMGYTGHQTRWAASYGHHTAAAVLGVVTGWQRRMRDERGCGWVYAADEVYLLSGVPFPPAEEYDGFPQFENGIGMASAFLDEFRSPGVECRAATLVTGELFAPVLRGALDRAGCADVRVLAVENGLFGGNVSVTGLLCGADIVRAIAEDGRAGTYLVPDVVVNSDGLLLDDMPSARLASESGADVRIIGTDAASLTAALAAL
ncbi:MAG: DUF512 domain-containing protein [Coriobacteriia bacterium]|nr:DUF512 domain-containing protein [Coriobacteriia bacterium]